MINLLPPDSRKELLAARSNTLLLRYNFFMIGALVFLVVAIAFTYYYLMGLKTMSEETVRSNNAKVSDLSAVQAKATQFRSNLQQDSSILAESYNYTAIMQEIAQLLPPFTSLDTLTLDHKAFGTQQSLSASTKTVESVLLLKGALQKSKYFASAEINTISTKEDPTYPISVTLNVIVKKEAK